jgi:hypothetical protein
MVRKAFEAAPTDSTDARNSLSNLARVQWQQGALSGTLATLSRWRALYGDGMTILEALMMVKRWLFEWDGLDDIDAWIRASPALGSVSPYHLQMLDVSMPQMRQVRRSHCVYDCAQ